MCLGIFFFLLPFLLAGFLLFGGDLPSIMLFFLIASWLLAGLWLWIWEGDWPSPDFPEDDDERFRTPTDSEEEEERLRGKRWND